MLLGNWIITLLLWWNYMIVSKIPILVSFSSNAIILPEERQKLTCSIAWCNYMYTYTCGNIVNTIMTNEHSSLEKYILYFIWNGCERVMCERWVGDWTKTATYWPPVPPSLEALLSRSSGLLNWGPWGPSPLLRAGSHCFKLQQLTPN